MFYLKKYNYLKSKTIGFAILLALILIISSWYIHSLSPSYYFYGDSITTGEITDNHKEQRWATIFCNLRHVTQHNFGQSGEPLTGEEQGFGVNSGFLGRYTGVIPKKNNTGDRLVFAYDTNDIGTYYYYGAAKATKVSTFKSSYRRVFAFCIKQGWKADDILVISRYYFVNYSNKKIQVPIDQNRANDFSNAVMDVCKEFGIKNCINLNEAMIEGGGITILAPDKTHPNIQGHRVIAEAINSWLNKKPYFNRKATF